MIDPKRPCRHRREVKRVQCKKVNLPRKHEKPKKIIKFSCFLNFALSGLNLGVFNDKSIYWKPYEKLKFCCWAALAKQHFTGCVFGDMLLELFAPQGLKGMAAAIQGVKFGRIRPFTAQITPLNPRGFNSSIIVHILNNLYYRKIDLKV